MTLPTRNRARLFVGKGECRYRSLSEGRSWLRRCLRHNPLHLRALILLAASLFGARGVDLATRGVRQLLGRPRRALLSLRRRFEGAVG